MKRLFALTIAVAFVAGCDMIPILNDILNPDDTNQETGSAKLIPFESEEDLTNYFAQQVNAQNDQIVNTFGEEEFRGDVDVDQALDSANDDGGTGGAAPPADPSPGVTEDGDAGGDQSQTTLQEIGVDEADVIKTDGTHLYLIADSKLKIVQINPANSLAMMGEVQLEGYGRDIYLRDGMIVALSETFGGFFVDPIFEDDVFVDVLPPDVDLVSQPADEAGGSSGSDGQSEPGDTDADDKPDVDIADDVVEPGIAPQSRYERPRTVVSIIDVTNPTNPVITTQYKFEGVQSSSRMVDGNLYLVLANYQNQFFDVMPLLGRPELTAEPMPAEIFLPKFDRVAEDGSTESGDVLTWSNLYRPEDPDGFGILSVISIDTDDPAEFDSVGVMAEPGLIYSSRSALYLTDTNYDFRGRQRETTDVYKFDYVDGVATPVATGSVPGRILNQYSMGEHEGFLRIASTVGPQFDQNFNQIEPVHNNVYVLEQSGDQLTVVGSVTDIAPRETIQSARFIGDKGYVVTFEQIDPLFTLDLADPRNPQIIGELKVPGFSTFIVPMDEDHLLTVGQYIPEQDVFFRPWGVQLSIFDVSDFANPFLEHLYVIGEETGSWSEALHNPKAFNYQPELGMVALPVSIYSDRPVFFDDVVFEDGGGGVLDEDNERTDESVASDDEFGEEDVPGDDPISSETPGEEPPINEFPTEPIVDESFDGIMVFSLSAEQGFTPMGRLSTRVEPFYYGASFTRALFLDDKIFAVTDRAVRNAPVADLDAVSERIELILDDGDLFDVFDGPFPVEPDGGIGDGAEPLPDGPIPVEPDGGIGDGAGPPR